jgi:putative DNA primase/helicase
MTNLPIHLPFRVVPTTPVGTSDVEASDALLDAVGDRVRFVHDAGKSGQWYGFIPYLGHWRPLSDGEMIAVARAIGKTSSRTAKSAITMATGEPRFHASLHDLDTQPWLFNVRNGTLNLAPSGGLVEYEPGVFHEVPPDWAWEFKPHDPADLLTQVAGCSFDDDATCPRWDSFLERVQPDPEVRAFLQRLIGYALVGNQTEAVFPVLYGKGANGKSTFVDILAELFGSYSCVAEKSLFKAVRSDGHPADRAVLINKRLARSEELPDVELDEPKIKGLTGGDKISGRGMRENFREWAPTHTFLVHSNTKPRLSGTDDGIWRRVILVPFNVRISTEEADPYLKPKLLAELSGILNWALRGYEAYCERGLAVPEVLRAAVAEYRAESDTVSAFVSRYEPDPGGTAFGVVQDHKDYALENGLDHGEAAKNYKAVCAALSDMGGKTKAVWNPVLGKSQRAWVGIRPVERG